MVPLVLNFQQGYVGNQEQALDPKFYICLPSLVCRPLFRNTRSVWLLSSQADAKLQAFLKGRIQFSLTCGPRRCGFSVFRDLGFRWSAWGTTKGVMKEDAKSLGYGSCGICLW